MAKVKKKEKKNILYWVVLICAMAVIAVPLLWLFFASEGYYWRAQILVLGAGIIGVLIWRIIVREKQMKKEK
jgi:hypothetical protein